MRSTYSQKVKPEQFSKIAEYFAVGGEADLFLTGGGFIDEAVSYICLQPVTEMILTDKITRDDAALFIFANSLPTFGFLSYNIGEAIKGIGRSAKSDFPPGYLKKYNIILKYDLAQGQLDIISNSDTSIAMIRSEIDKIDTDLKISSPLFKIAKVTASISRDDYIAGVKRALELIKDGNIYQLNLTIKYRAVLENLDPELLFIDLFRNYPAPYYCYYRCGDYHLISTSPELFLRIRDGQVLSRPIKGTLRFDKFNKALVKKLTDSPKEAAELSMIVDMVRNDIGYNCETGSIDVKDHKSTFTVDNLLQMYSNVAGTLKGKSTVLDLLWDAFPGASVTGCPKLAAMKYIAELEPHRRNAYCGSFVIIHDEKNMDSSVAIRTADYDADSGEFAFYAGSGIVIDSVPDKEYEETTSKAEKFLKYFS